MTNPLSPLAPGLSIRFSHRPDDTELGRLEDSTVSVNEAHPAFRRAAALRAEDYRVALTIALTPTPLTEEPAAARRCLTAFVTRHERSRRAKAPALWSGALSGSSCRHRFLTCR